MATTYRQYYSLVDENKTGIPFPVVCRSSQLLSTFTQQQEQTQKASLLDINKNKGD